MAEKRKFAALADLHRQKPEPHEAQAVTETAVMPSAVLQETEKGRGRPATGKRSNPEWRLYSHFLKRQTQRAAMARLLAEDRDQDLSDVLQGLLENWLKT